MKKIGLRVILPAMIGVITFLVIYGITPLDVTNDKWIMAGYDEYDIVQNYAGWLSLRNSDWAYPLGLAEDMGYGEGTCIAFTDSAPWVVIFFKVFRDWLPATFQYFGLYTLYSFILQGIAAFNIVYKESKNTIYSALGTLLFTFSPIMIERAFRHVSLVSHWLVLFALLLYLYHRENGKKIHYWGYLFLLVSAIGIHPYFLPMVAVFMVLCVWEDLKNKKYISLIWLLGSLIITYDAGCVIGVLGSGIDGSSNGFGFFSMNLNAIINPFSRGQNTWSCILPVQNQVLGNYDGFNYLGLGVLCGITVLLFHAIKTKQILKLGSILKKEWMLIGILIFCTLFAISNVVTLNEFILLEIPLPGILEKLCGIFRASSRMFYPVYYCIFVGLLIYLWRMGNGNKKVMFTIFGIMLFVQLFDMHNCIEEKHQGMIAHAEYESMITDSQLAALAKDAEYLILDNHAGHAYMGSNHGIAVWGGKNNLKLYFTIANRGDNDRFNQRTEAVLGEIKATGELNNHIIVTDEYVTAQQYSTYENFKIYDYKGTYFVYEE